MTIHVTSDPPADSNSSSSSSSSPPLTPLGGVEKIEKDYKIIKNKNGTVTVIKIISLKYGDEIREFTLKIYNIAEDPKVISKFLGEQENRLLSIAITQLTRNKSGSVLYDKEKDSYSTFFRRPFLLTFLQYFNPFSKPAEEKKFSVNTTSKEKFFDPQIENFKAKIELYDTIQRLRSKLNPYDRSGLTKDELELFDVMKSKGEITSIDKYRKLFAKDVYYSESYSDSLPQKRENLEARIQLCTTAARVYLSLTIPKAKPAPATPPTPPIPNPLRRTVDRTPPAP